MGMELSNPSSGLLLPDYYSPHPDSITTMKALLATAIALSSLFIATPAQAACGVLNNSDVCVSDGGTGYDFLFAEGPAGVEFIRVACGQGKVFYWESNGKNTQEYVIETTRQWCGG